MPPPIDRVKMEADKPSAGLSKSQYAKKTIRWLFELVNNDFFHACEKHKHAKKNDCTFFCTTCGCKPFCQHCLKDHETHEVLQIRRYVYHDVVKAQDVQRYFDTSGVQTYIINGSRVIFLRDRPQPKPTKTLNACKSCKRACRDQFCFCSLRCKIKYCVSDPRGLTDMTNFDFSKSGSVVKAEGGRKRKAASMTSFFSKCRLNHRRKQSMPRRSPVF
ncbi:PLATZ transcription factor [Chloropicon roscoffensis]|uniref:PLATZ transcription factor n=1 Tax=Chloropicon roscoffensis TaxID=1461544 RepID=A0AAX4PHZ2_9CHLO